MNAESIHIMPAPKRAGEAHNTGPKPREIETPRTKSRVEQAFHKMEVWVNGAPAIDLYDLARRGTSVHSL